MREGPRQDRGAAPGRAGPLARPGRLAGARALGYVCLTWRDFDRAWHHLDLVRAMNPNDAQIDHLGVGPGLPRRARARAARGRAGDAAQPAPPALLRALLVVRP